MQALTNANHFALDPQFTIHSFATGRIGQRAKHLSLKSSHFGSLDAGFGQGEQGFEMRTPCVVMKTQATEPTCSLLWAPEGTQGLRESKMPLP